MHSIKLGHTIIQPLLTQKTHEIDIDGVSWQALNKKISHTSTLLL